MATLKITTVQDFIDHEAGLSFWCPACERGGMIDMVKLKLLRGGDFNLYKLPRPFVCEKCRGKLTYSLHGPGTTKIRGITRG